MTIAASSENLPDGVVDQYLRKGWRLESRTDNVVVFVKGHRTNHLLHLILSIITLGIWLPIWLLVAAFTGERRKVVTL